MFGLLLTDHALKHDPIEYLAGITMFLSGLIIIGLIFYLKRWKWLWKEWLTSLDPKKIGIMYLTVAFLMLFKGLIDAVMMRVQQAIAVGDSQGYLGADHFQQIFTAHGSTMIFFVAMGIVFGLLNLIVPLQIGARDVAFPFMNAVSFWLFASGGSFIMLSLVVGNFSGAGWLGYPPLSGLQYSPGVGVDYWIWTLQIAGVGSLLSGINFLVTIFKLRCPGMTFMKMPIFVWCALGTVILIIFAFPILTTTLALLTLDRLIDTRFFTPDFGGNPMMYINLIWAWGHPEVYILILPAFGIFSEVVPTFSRKPLFGYVSMVWAIVAITFLSFIVWVHHFFTMGSSANVNAFFGIMTMLIAIPTGVKIFNWLFTMFRGQVRFISSMLWFLGFVFLFTLGGMAGVLLSIPPIDYQVHNSLFLVAHFHSVIIGGVLFGFFAGYTYWFPKYTGFKLNETLGKLAFWSWFFGFIIAFMPLYILGFMGATRRLNHYQAATHWQTLFIVAGVGVLFIFLGISLQILQFVVSVKQRKQNRDVTGDPWDGRTLEWSISSPPPIYNFAEIPHVSKRDPFWVSKHSESQPEKPHYQDIYLPKDTPIALYIGGLSFLFGFGLIWHMFWLAGLSFLGIIACLIIRTSRKEHEERVSASEVEKIETEAKKRALST